MAFRETLRMTLNTGCQFFAVWQMACSYGTRIDGFVVQFLVLPQIHCMIFDKSLNSKYTEADAHTSITCSGFWIRPSFSRVFKHLFQSQWLEVKHTLKCFAEKGLVLTSAPHLQMGIYYFPAWGVLEKIFITDDDLLRHYEDGILTYIKAKDF